MNEAVKKYLDKQKSPQREILLKIRKLILEVAPQAKERLGYGVPAFDLRGGLVLYAAFKEHVGLYPEPAAIKAFEKELAGYETSKGTIKFKIDQPIPYGLIKKIIVYKNKIKK